MSFDLFVWHEGAPISADEAGSKLDRWTDGESDVFRPHPAVSMFRDAILTRFPPPENHGADSVWSVTPAPSESIAALSCTWSRADEVSDAVLELAGEHGLVCYDPGSHVVTPDGAGSVVR